MAKPSTKSNRLTPAIELPDDRMQELFLPVHGYVRLYPEEVAIISHPAFQRLRRVRQLGFAHLLFPGGVHTRFEHSIGTMHVAQRILNNIDLNSRRHKGRNASDSEPFLIQSIEDSVRIFIRLGALCHDIGHLPFGHTLEDELEHLDKHDGADRVNRISGVPYPEYEIDPRFEFTVARPPEGWNFRSLVDELYAKYLVWAKSNDQISPYEVLKTIILKPPSVKSADESVEEEPEEAKVWRETFAAIEKHFPISVCRDIVGNTICADLLDYLFRDWYHLGKAINEDKRLYQYMEVRAPVEELDNPAKLEFVINAGSQHKRRHDALTNILDLLDSRYKLAETVLFHRTKISATALLDRCLLEIRKLYEACNISVSDNGKDWEAYLKDETVDLLLHGSDDALADILEQLAEGGRHSDAREAIRVLKEKQRRALKLPQPQMLEAVDEDQPLPLQGAEREPDLPELDVGGQIELIMTLIERLRSRTIYTPATKWRIDELGVPFTIDNKEVKKITQRFVRPENRSLFLSAVEAVCNLPAGSVTMYCPPSANMNAKIADVKLYLDHEVVEFWKYETQAGQAGLTCGALRAQVDRFYQLWSVQFFVHRKVWHDLNSESQAALQSVLRDFFHLRIGVSPQTRREQIESSISRIRSTIKTAARSGTQGVDLAGFEGKLLPNGMPIILSN